MSMIISYIELSELPSASQKAARDEYLAAQVTAGTTNGLGASYPGALGSVRSWPTTEAANAYVAFVNANYGSIVVQSLVTTVG